MRKLTEIEWSGFLRTITASPQFADWRLVPMHTPLRKVPRLSTHGADLLLAAETFTFVLEWEPEIAVRPGLLASRLAPKMLEALRSPPPAGQNNVLGLFKSTLAYLKDGSSVRVKFDIAYVKED